jgi:uroporphyrinogen-III synthase
MEDSARTLAALRRDGHQTAHVPLFTVRALAASLGGQHDAIMATSANAVRQADRSGLQVLTGLPFHAVGASTAEAARAAGFVQVHAAEGDSHDLARQLLAKVPPGSRILQLAGRPRRDEAIAALGRHFRLTVAETYETVASARLPASLGQMLTDGTLDAVLHFSPRAAVVFADLAQAEGLLAEVEKLTHVFISAAAVDPRLPRARIAAKPSLESIIAAL